MALIVDKTASDVVVQDDAVVSSFPCFAAGTLIRSAGGDVPIELLAAGDLVETRDAGPQPIRWVGHRAVSARGKLAPVVIEAGTLGNQRRMVLSPQHRVLIQHHMAELMFGEDEVLVAAKDLVNDDSVCREQGGSVEYVHVLFDEHQVIYSEGLATESFLPGPMTFSSFEEEAKAEITSLFPELDPQTGAGYGAAARPILRGYETRVLLAPNLE